MCKIILNYISQLRQKRVLEKERRAAVQDLCGWYFPGVNPQDDGTKCVKWIFTTERKGEHAHVKIKVDYCPELNGSIVPADKVCTNTECQMFPKYANYLSILKKLETRPEELKAMSKREKVFSAYVETTKTKVR